MTTTLQNNGLHWSPGTNNSGNNQINITTDYYGTLVLLSGADMYFQSQGANGYIFGKPSQIVGGCLYALGSSYAKQPVYYYNGSSRAYPSAGAIISIPIGPYYSPSFTEPAGYSYNTDLLGGYSLVAANRMLCCGGEIDVFSDERIKCNIEELHSDDSLDMIRKLTPVKYNYKDFVKQGQKDNFGFIAQDVKKVVPSSVSLYKDFVPNIYESVDIIDKNTIKLTNKTKQDFAVNDVLPLTIKLFLFDAETQKETEQIVTVKEFIDDQTILLNEEINTNIAAFLFGQEVEDLNVLNYGSIHVLNISAVKQLDRELQETKQVVTYQQAQINTLQEQIQQLQEKMNKLL